MARIPLKDEENAKMILVDTSVWVDFFRGIESKENKALRVLIQEEMDLAICGVILQEILQGLPSDVHAQKIKRNFQSLHYLELEEPDLFEAAAKIYRNCRRKGKTPRKPVDCLIAAIAIHYKVSLLHKDKDFDSIALANSLKIYQP